VAQQRQRGPAVPARARPSAAASARPSRGQLARQRQTGRAQRGARAGWQAGGRGGAQARGSAAQRGECGRRRPTRPSSGSARVRQRASSGSAAVGRAKQQTGRTKMYFNIFWALFSYIKAATKHV